MPRKLARLFVESDLFQGQRLSLDLRESHYLGNVLRLTSGDAFLIFNGRNGEWVAEVAQTTKKQTNVNVKELVRSQKDDFPVALLFSPLKAGPLGFLMEKATELGVTDFYPLWTTRTQGRDFRHERYLSIIREASEQSERMSVPFLHKPLFLDKLLTQWDREKELLICDERPGGRNLFDLLQGENVMNSVVIGPEGGFSPEEFEFLDRLPNAIFVSLGQNVLRAETAALSALSLLHSKISWMQGLSLRILALFFLVMCQVNFIQAPASSDYEIMPTPEAPSASRKLDKSQRDALKTLIKNLESKQERQLLINDLRTLVKAEDQLAQDRPSSGLGLSTISNGLHSMTSKIIEFFDEVQHALERLSKYMKNEELRSSILTTGYWILGIIITAIGIDIGLKSLHMPLRHLFVMNARKEHLSHKRLIINVGIFESLIIVCLFVIMLTGLSFVDSASTPGLILELTIVNLVFYLVVLHVLRTLFYYKQKLVTVFYLNKDTGKLIYRFLRFITAITILGMSMGEAVTMIDGPPVFYAAIIKTMLLTQCIVASIFVVRVKDRVRLWLLSENEDKEETGLSSKAAKTWHVWVLVYLFVFGLTIYFQTINNMKEVIVSFGATAFLVAIAYLLVLKMPVMSYGMMDKVVTSFPHMASRHRFYGIFTSLIFGVFIIITALYGAFKIWDLETVDFLFSDGVKPVFTTLLNIFFIAVIGVFVWEANEYLIQQIFKNEVMAHKNRARRQRLATMMPLVQIIARGFILGIFVIMAFSELKLDVTPLLAGLGVIGIAFSFGSQSLVKDFITGIFILIEDTMNVGDIVQIDTQKGTVETLSLRTVKLRDTAGDLHTIPFSTINRVTNMTKNFSYYVVELLLPFEQDMEPVIETIKEVGQQIHEDAGFKNYILGEVEIMGLDRFADYGVVMMARIKTVPDKHRWVVGREFNLRIQKLFNERNIEFSTTTQKIFLTSEGEKQAS